MALLISASTLYGPTVFDYPPMLHLLTALWFTPLLAQDTAHVVLVARAVVFMLFPECG